MEHNGAGAEAVVESGMGGRGGGGSTVFDHAVMGARKMEPVVGSGQDGTWRLAHGGRGTAVERDRLDWH